MNMWDKAHLIIALKNCKCEICATAKQQKDIHDWVTSKQFKAEDNT